jgi:magnesium-transporting ATPase (P-type)
LAKATAGVMDAPSEEHISTELDSKQRAIIIGAFLFLVVLIIGVVVAVISMVNHPDQTETIRDIVIIFMAVESLVIGLTLIVLIIQLAKLTALLQNEIRPILDSTNETVQTLRGTTTFLSNNLVKPVIKANSTLAAVRQALGLIGINRSNSKD